MHPPVSSLIRRSAWLGLLVLLLPARAQADASNLFGANGGFEHATQTVDNLWDGVDGDGRLAGFNASANVVTESGGFGGLAMPLRSRSPISTAMASRT